MRFWPIMVGDRVVVMEGREKGKIGMVKGTDKEREELTVEGLNKVCCWSLLLPREAMGFGVLAAQYCYNI